MIFADSNFLESSQLKDECFKSVEGLTESTGAHIVVSEKLFPPLGDLVKKHAQGNSVFLYVTEFPDGEADTALRKMIELEVASMGFVTLGMIQEGEGDVALVDDKQRGSYHAYVNWVVHLASSGAMHTNLSPAFLVTYVKKLEEYLGDDVSFMPISIREYKPITDGTITLATVPSIGVRLAKDIRDRWVKAEQAFNLIDIIALYTNERKCSGNLYAKSVCAATRKWFGVPDGWNISLEPIEEE